MPIPPSKRIRAHILAVPEDRAVKQSYLDLGWQQFPGLYGENPYIKWPYDLRSPEYPGEVSQPDFVRPFLNDLPPSLVDFAHGTLPFQAPPAPHHRDVVVAVTIRFESKPRASRARASGNIWQPVEAAMAIKAGGEAGQAATECE